MYWGLVDRPNLMIKIPATPEGIPAIETALYEGMNVNVTLLFGVAALRGGDARVHPRDGAPPRRGPAARPPLGRLVLRLARRHRGRQAAGRRSAATDLAGPRRARQRARRLPGVPAGVRRRASSPRCATAGCPVQRPLWASTGVKNPAYPETLYVYGLVGAGHGQHDAAADAAGRRGRGRGDRRDGRRRPDAPTWRRCAEAGIDLDDVTDQLLRDGHRGVRRADEQAARRASRPSARRSSPAARRRSRPTCRPSSSSRSPSGCARRAERRRRAPHLAQGRHALGAGRARRSSRTGSAG